MKNEGQKMKERKREREVEGMNERKNERKEKGKKGKVMNSTAESGGRKREREMFPPRASFPVPS
jgi:hypothetical protein